MHIVLVEPEIHTNTGNIGRLSLATGSHLHLVKPFGFELTDARLKRAGLDYWQHIELTIYENFLEFFEKNKDRNMAFLSSHGTKDYTEIPFDNEVMLVFGKESKGLSSEITNQFKDQLYTIPQYSKHIRSINLANAVAVITYEGLRQLRA
ncbi:tRNA (cytidine/uridine-2'-O-)-methyltransferase [Nonlabens dokdonensis]|jgi:tRNA (cytidine/uridine-2'-O-)-methyltransferase|uniref:Putative tRNA (cytidine(34)-2'-O)-methyltransferase n=2 Tax=Nonlabens dokdonensis TaxID=328515 RepID=L7WE40_NONDD|nr:tRNA (cytidine(34)-2'-O)-methyltransferase [Nonlabens dokdonensis]AGC78349.1 putative rRNA methylase (SpoU class) [Nonlabens dokdonensis DSW-6]PZX38101.1 tRNA (cytidine/uridine-2'-O-)-methyltransferase [Nonlabens dokdonensis]